MYISCDKYHAHALLVFKDSMNGKSYLCLLWVSSLYPDLETHQIKPIAGSWVYGQLHIIHGEKEVSIKCTVKFYCLPLLKKAVCVFSPCCFLATGMDKLRFLDYYCTVVIIWLTTSRADLSQLQTS